MLDLVSCTVPSDFSAAHSYSTNPSFSSKRYYCEIWGVYVVCVHVMYVCGSLRITLKYRLKKSEGFSLWLLLIGSF